MARTHKHAPAHHAPQSTGRADWREIIRTRDTKRAQRRAHARNAAPQRAQLGAATLRLIVCAGVAVCATLAIRGLFGTVVSALQSIATHGGF